MHVSGMTELEEGRLQLAKQLDEYESLMDAGKKRHADETSQLEKRAQVRRSSASKPPAASKNFSVESAHMTNMILRGGPGGLTREVETA
jgi:hypothetical protein